MRKGRSSIVGLVAILTLGTLPMVYGQIIQVNPLSNSPYSRIGLGDVVNQTLAAQAGMGNLAAANQNPLGLNLINPASLAFQQATSFEVGVFGEYNFLEDSRNSVGQWAGNLSYLALGFPLYNPINRAIDRIERPFSWGMSFSLQPYTNVGYNIEAISEDDIGGQVRSSFKGAGGTYRLMWGNGVRYKNLAIGAQIGYLFGKISNDRSIVLDSVANSYDSRFLNEFSVSGFMWNVGFMYILDFKSPDQNGLIQPNGKRIIIGAFGRSQNTFNTNSSSLFFRESRSLLRFDTVFFQEDQEGRGRLPLELSGGITFEDVNKLKVGAEIAFAQWDNYFNDATLEGVEDLPSGVTTRSLSNSWKVSTGLEFTPDFNSFGNYLKKMSYRLGGFYGKDPRSLNGVQLDTYGLSFGLGFPLIMPRETISYINLAVEAGRIGANASLQQSYIRMTLGFSLNDNTWFFKRKFN